VLAPCAHAGRPDVPPVVDAIFNRLFDGIPLTREQEDTACDLIVRLQREQAAQDDAAALALAANRVRRSTLETARDSALRALLTNDADRATFDVQAAEARAGSGPGLGGAWLDSAARGGRGGGGGRGRGGTVDSVRMRGSGGRGGGRGAALDTTASRGGGRGRGRLAMDTAASGQRGGRGGGVPDLDELNLRIIDVATEMTMRRLFAGITLSADQQSRARALITQTQQEMRAQTSRPEPPRLRLNPATGLVTMQPASADALSALVTNEADRAKLVSRIVTGPQFRPRDDA
jgi:hypothetical protein